jgi:hypothetical protein
MEEDMRPRLVSIRTLAVIGVVTVLLAGLPLQLAQPNPALGQTEPQRTRELHAVFSSTNPGGIVTDVLLEVTDGPGGAEAVIEVSRYRPTCAHNGCVQVVFHAFNRVPLAAGALQMSGELDAAKVQGSGPVRERLMPTAGTVSLDMTWTGVGTVASDEHEEGERSRRATAAGALRAGPTNFTPQVSVGASIEAW